MEKYDLNSLLLAFILSIVPTLGYGSVQTTASVKKVIHTCKKTDTPANILACNVYMEARGESLNGQLAVAFVTMNRLKQKKFPSSVRHVVFQQKQFSWVGGKSVVSDKLAWQNARAVAGFVYSIRDKPEVYDWADPTHGSTYFHTTQRKPYWASLFKKRAVIGNHVFYQDTRT